MAGGLSALGTSLGILLPGIAAYASMAKLNDWRKGPTPTLPDVPPTPGGGGWRGGLETLAAFAFRPILAAIAAKGYMEAYDPKNAGDAWADKNIPGYGWLDYKLNKLAYGTKDDAADRRAFNESRGITPAINMPAITLNVSVDGKLAKGTVKMLLTSAAGPETSTGGYDMGHTFSSPAH